MQKLIRYPEESPRNRQALPDAGNKIGGYCRRLRREPNESVPSFLIRDDKVHDEMLKALQRLLREKELDFDNYEVTIEEVLVGDRQQKVPPQMPGRRPRRPEATTWSNGSWKRV